jgi:hypothetical protein
MKLVALGVATKVIMVVQHEDSAFRAQGTPIQMSSGQAGNPGPDYDKIEMLTGVLAHE